MATLEVVLWACVVGGSIWGIAAKDWRASIITLVASLVAIILLLVGHR